MNYLEPGNGLWSGATHNYRGQLVTPIGTPLFANLNQNLLANAVVEYPEDATCKFCQIIAISLKKYEKQFMNDGSG